MASLNPYVDGYGVGTTITNARVIDFAMDIVEIEGEPVAKRGKMSGSKRVLRCTRCFKDSVIPLQGHAERCGCGGNQEELLVPWYDRGAFLFQTEKPQSIRRFVLDQLEHFGLEP